eukprot:TRINITY_DN1361_c1_g1_i5.p5 TRINITY_DN1361_c1_g1~~TRINITY_DN1361_c1_g1_i5.p5  ORF type:complete len:113 (+),score=5.10 TRINITY_DN1361_c1_g1_i5:129-467(+)
MRIPLQFGKTKALKSAKKNWVKLVFFFKSTIHISQQVWFSKDIFVPEPICVEILGLRLQLFYKFKLKCLKKYVVSVQQQNSLIEVQIIQNKFQFYVLGDTCLNGIKNNVNDD